MNKEKYKLIFSGSNKILDAHARKQFLKTSEYIELLSQYCTILTLLNEDDGLYKVLAEAETRSKNTVIYREAKAILESTREFNKLLVLEKELLVSAGVSPAFSEHIVELSENLRTNALDISNRTLDSRVWIQNFEILNKAVCAASKEADQKLQELKRIQATLQVGGQALMAGNGLSFFGTAGLSAPYAIASILLGAAMSFKAGDM